MSKDLIRVGVGAELPAHIAALSDQVREMNSDAAHGVSAGMAPSLRIKNSRFKLHDGNEEIVIPAKDLVESEHLPVVVLGVKRDLDKSFYAKAFDPNQEETSPPDCYSTDGKTPAADSPTPQCANCASCLQNAFGSGKNAAGEATKGKACTDNKTLAIAYKSSITGQLRTYSCKIPPASLKNWASYVRALDAHNLPLGYVITFLSFDEKFDYPVLKFEAGSYVPEARLAAFAELSAAPEVDMIVNRTAAPLVAAITAPAKTEEPAAEDEAKTPDAVEVPKETARAKKARLAAEATAAAADEASAVESTDADDAVVADLLDI